MEEDTKKEKTGEETDGLPTSSSPPEELSWWNGRKVKFEDIMDPDLYPTNISKNNLAKI